MDFGWDATTQQWRERLLAFMDEHVYPAEPVFDGADGAACAGRLGAAAGRSVNSVPPARAPGCGTCSCPVSAGPG